jgi:phenylalanyl-tRNA synthetase alpha chain
MAEHLQQLILGTLDAHGSIQDTRALVFPGQTDPAASNDDQIAILGALNSLLSREVRVRESLTYITYLCQCR